MAAPMLWEGVMTRVNGLSADLRRCAAIVVSEQFARKRGLAFDVVIASQALTTDLPSTYD